MQLELAYAKMHSASSINLKCTSLIFQPHMLSEKKVKTSFYRFLVVRMFLISYSH